MSRIKDKFKKIKKCTSCGVLRPISKFHIANKATGLRRGDCAECRKPIRRKQYQENKEHTKKTVAIWRAKNRKRRLAVNAEWQKNNRDKMSTYYKTYAQNHPEKMKEKQIKRLYSEFKSTPEWLTDFDKEYIKHIYKQRNWLSKNTDDVWHVDHIIPLRGKTVCGLHVPWNLQIITKTENLSKGNRLCEQGGLS